MPSSQHNNWWRLHVSALLQEFMKSNVRTSIRFKALAVMGVVNSHAGGFGYCTEMSSAEVANEIGVPGSSISNTLRLLDDLNVIRRDPAEGRGGRLVITPLGPEYWLLPNGHHFQPHKTNGAGFREGKGGSHQENPTIQETILIKKEIFNNHVGMSYKEMQPEWGQLFEKVLKYVDQSRVMTAFTPSKLLGMVAVVTQNTEKPGVPCKLNQKEISKILHLPEEGVGKTLKKLEEIGVIKRVRGQGRNYITPILPDKVSDETATVDCCDAPKEISK